MSRCSTGELVFVSAWFRSRLVWWLTAAADQGRSKRDREKRPQAIPLEDQYPPSFALRIDLRARVYLVCKNVKGALSVGVLNARSSHMVNVGTAVAASICTLADFRRQTCVSHQNRSYVSLWQILLQKSVEGFREQ
jgi:hypothetical protein